MGSCPSKSNAEMDKHAMCEKMRKWNIAASWIAIAIHIVAVALAAVHLAVDKAKFESTEINNILFLVMLIAAALGTIPFIVVLTRSRGSCKMESKCERAFNNRWWILVSGFVFSIAVAILAAIILYRYVNGNESTDNFGDGNNEQIIPIVLLVAAGIYLILTVVYTIVVSKYNKEELMGKKESIELQNI